MIKNGKKKLEKDIQREICDWLASERYFFWRNNTIPVFSEGKFRALPKYTPRGLPDIIILWQGKFVGLEVKRPDERGNNPATLAAQQKMAGEIRNAGGRYFIVHSREEAENAMHLVFLSYDL